MTIRRHFLRFTSTTVALLGVLLSASPALALEPLEVFLDGARSQNFDLREQALVQVQREWETNTALGRLLPSFSARGVYQFNQYAAEFAVPGTDPPVMATILPQHQLDAYFSIDAPLIDIAGHHRHKQAGHIEKATKESTLATELQVETTVARTYFLLVSAAALVDSAEKSVASAEDNFRFVDTRAQLGAATSLDVERARANVERFRQDLADAILNRDLAARQLETLSGVRPSRVEEYPEVSLDPQGELSEWLTGAETPADRAQKESEQAAIYGRKAAKAALLPTLSANVTERLTNATSFTGQVATFTAQAVLAVKLDWAAYSNGRAQEAAAEAQLVRSERTKRSTEDSIYEAYQRVTNGIVRSKAARAQAEAANKAAEFALERYRSGAATQLDVTQAQRDALNADAARVRADADLALARIQLVTATGQKLDPNRLQMRRAPLRSPDELPEPSAAAPSAAAPAESPDASGAPAPSADAPAQAPAPEAPAPQTP